MAESPVSTLGPRSTRGPQRASSCNASSTSCFNARTPVNPGPARTRAITPRISATFQRSDPGQPGARLALRGTEQGQKVSTLGPRSTRGPRWYARNRGEPTAFQRSDPGQPGARRAGRPALRRPDLFQRSDPGQPGARSELDASSRTARPFQRSDPGQPGARFGLDGVAFNFEVVSTLGPRSTRGPRLSRASGPGIARSFNARTPVNPGPARPRYRRAYP